MFSPSAPLKVLVVSALFPREGAPNHGVFVHRQVRAIRDAGVDARVLCPVAFSRPGQVTSALLRRTEWDGVPVRYFAYWQVPIRLSPALHGRRLLGALRRALEPEAGWPDLYHAHWLFPTAWAAVRAVADTGRPVVASARGSDVHTHPRRSRRIRRLTHDVLASATVVSVVSRALAEQARRLGPAGLDVEVVHNGVDAELFAPAQDRARIRRELGLSEDGFLWVSICHLLRQKGTEELLDAFTRLAGTSPGARLVVVGSGPDLASLRRRLTERGLSERVTFAGLRPPVEVARWLQAGDAFVLASHNEGLPNAVLEAMATGLPVVATDVGGTREAVLDGESGLLVRPRDPDALAAAMSRVASDHGLAARLGAEGRKRVDRHFGWRASAGAWIELYEKAMRLGSARRSAVPPAAVGG